MPSLVALCLLTFRPAIAADQATSSLYQQSIRSTKQSIARETLDVFYREAIDYYHDRRYDEALELLDKIYSIDPGYADVARMRDAIRKSQTTRVQETTRDTVRHLMRKAGEALKSGQNVLAISFWKQALAINPAYEPAKKKIQEVNHALAQKQFEAGYLHYHHGDLEDALDAWANAMALGPSFKQGGLLLLMSKVERRVRQDQIARLASQGYEQYQAKELDRALQSYQELLRLEPRHEEARRMSGKIKIQLGQAAFKSAGQNASKNHYADAIKGWQASIRYGYEVPRSQKAIQEAEAALKRTRERLIAAKKPKPTTPEATASSATVTAESVPTAPPAQPANPEEALQRYRSGLVAIRNKDFRRAVDELEIAAQLDPSNERIYMARERAKQEWAAMNANTSAPESK